MNVWRLMAYHVPEQIEAVIAHSRREGVLSVGNAVGDLRLRHFRSQQDIARFCAEAHPGSTPSGWGNGGKSLWSWYSNVQIGDLVILSAGTYRANVFRVTGGYEYGEHEPSRVYEHRRKAQVLPINADVLWKLSGGAAPGESVRHTFIRCAHSLTDAEYAALIS